MVKDQTLSHKQPEERLAENIRLLREMGYGVNIPNDEPTRIIITDGNMTITLGEGKQLDDLVSGEVSIRHLWSEHRLNSCAIATFRDIADGDYIAARLAFREACYEQFLWSAEQAIEKYLNCILVLRRIPRPSPNKDGRRSDMGHSLHMGIDMIGAQTLQLSKPTSRFIAYLEKTALGSRYLEVATVAWGDELVSLDRAVWELRRFCTPSEDYSNVKLEDREPPQKIRLNGRLERVMDDPKSPGREALLWQNGFFGRRTRLRVRRPRWGFTSKNAPLYVMPDVAREFAKYAQVPKDAVSAYEELAKSRKTNSEAPTAKHRNPAT